MMNTSQCSPLSLRHLPNLGLLVTVFAALAAAPPMSRGAPPQAVATEPKPKFLPAGPHEKPFNVTRHTIRLSEIEAGGVGRDEIPALFQARFLSAAQADKLLKKSDRVVGFSWNGEAKAYPIRILNWHELVNDSVGGRPILVSW